MNESQRFGEQLKITFRSPLISGAILGGFSAMIGVGMLSVIGFIRMILDLGFHQELYSGSVQFSILYAVIAYPILSAFSLLPGMFGGGAIGLILSSLKKREMLSFWAGPILGCLIGCLMGVVSLIGFLSLLGSQAFEVFFALTAVAIAAFVGMLHGAVMLYQVKKTELIRH